MSKSAVAIIVIFITVTLSAMLYVGRIDQRQERTSLTSDVQPSMPGAQDSEAPTNTSSTFADDPPIQYAQGIFKPASDLIAKRLEPWIAEEYYRGKMHSGYVRHDIVEVDVNALTYLVNDQANVLTPVIAETGYVLEDIQLPVDFVIAEDKTLSVLFDRVSVVAPGKFALVGHVMTGPSNSKVKLVVDHSSGRIISGYVFDGGSSHVIAGTPEHPYYLVTEAVPRPTLIDDELVIED